MLSASGHEEVLYLQPLIPPKRFDIFSPITGGCCSDFSLKSMDQPGKVANPARGQLNRENEYFPVRVRA